MHLLNQTPKTISWWLRKMTVLIEYRHGAISARYFLQFIKINVNMIDRNGKTLLHMYIWPVAFSISQNAPTTLYWMSSHNIDMQLSWDWSWGKTHLVRQVLFTHRSVSAACGEIENSRFPPGLKNYCTRINNRTSVDKVINAEWVDTHECDNHCLSKFILHFF